MLQMSDHSSDTPHLIISDAWNATIWSSVLRESLKVGSVLKSGQTLMSPSAVYSLTVDSVGRKSLWHTERSLQQLVWQVIGLPSNSSNVALKIGSSGEIILSAEEVILWRSGVSLGDAPFQIVPKTSFFPDF